MSISWIKASLRRIQLYGNSLPHLFFFRRDAAGGVRIGSVSPLLPRFDCLCALVITASGDGHTESANVTMFPVMERTGEIGLRRAIGAARWQIVGQFVTEPVIIGLLVATTGVFAVAAIALSRQWTPTTNPLVAVGGALLGALVAGSFPARKATRIEPVTALLGT